MTRRFLAALLALVLMPVVAVAVLWATGRFQTKDIPIYGDLPPFELIDQSGRPFSLAQMKGSVWIASFLFTSCKGQCPLLAEKVQALQKKFTEDAWLKLVSFSVDPERDTPEILTKYAERFHAIPEKWIFATGDKGAVTALALNGFRLATGGQGADEEILHSFKLVLVDREGRIRGYYEAFDSAAIKALIADARALAR